MNVKLNFSWHDFPVTECDAVAECQDALTAALGECLDELCADAQTHRALSRGVNVSVVIPTQEEATCLRKRIGNAVPE